MAPDPRPGPADEAGTGEIRSQYRSRDRYV